MAYKEDRNCLGYLGAAYQYNLVKEFVEDKEYFKRLSSIIDQNVFTEPVLKSIVTIMRDHYAKYGAVPSYDTLKMYLGEQSHSNSERDTNFAIVDKLSSMTSDSAEAVKSKATKFFKQQNLVKAAHQILEIAGNGDDSKYELCEDIVHKALAAGNEEQHFFRVFDDYEDTLSKDYRCTIPTGIGKLDEALEGGLGKGELATIIGPSGYGKTSMTTGISSFAATYKCEQNNNKGFKVLQFVFEDKVKQLRRKHFSRVSEVEARKLSYDEEIFKVREATDMNNERCKMIQNNVLLGHYASGEISVLELKNAIKSCINNGFKPDLVIVDYFECLKLTRSGFDNDRWDAEGTTMRMLETIADEFDVGMWVPIQGTKDSLSADVVTMENGGGSFKKLQIAHINVSITRSLEDLANNVAKIAILKNRAGKSGAIFNNVYMNNGTCTISTDNSQECSDIIQYNEARAEDQSNLARKIFLQHREKKKINTDEAF